MIKPLPTFTLPRIENGLLLVFLILRQEVYDLPVIYNGFFILSHEPLYVNTNMPYANLFGHVHANPMYKDFSPQHVCVCVERTDYRPISMEEIMHKIQND